MAEIKTGVSFFDAGIDRLDVLSDSGERILDFLISKSHATQGIMATIFNETSNSGSFSYGIVEGINELIFKNSIGHGAIMILAAMLLFLYWCFFQNIIQVGKHRFFLETRLYKETKFGRIFYLYKLKRVGNVALTMFMRGLFLTLWMFTVVGGVIKFYSYRMIPIIMAENPNTHWRDAFKLSMRMMKGNKWKTFLLDLSFLGWMLLSFLSFGLVSVFYLHPYRETAEIELYMTLRQCELEKNTDDKNIFNDSYLLSKPTEKYHAGQRDDDDDEYPMALYSVPDRHPNHIFQLNPSRNYSRTDLILLFFSICFIGYVYEVIYYLVATGEIVNRGTMYGPWLPVYGCGGMITLLILKRWVKRPFITFISAMVICGILEYTTAWALETFFNTKWWDYTGFFMNIQGRVCLEQLIVFGLGCSLNIYFVSPLLGGLYEKIPKRAASVLCVILIVLFVTDLVFSFIHPNMAAGVKV